jgi:hypothetical protein
MTATATLPRVEAGRTLSRCSLCDDFDPSLYPRTGDGACHIVNGHLMPCGNAPDIVGLPGERPGVCIICNDRPRVGTLLCAKCRGTVGIR